MIAGGIVKPDIFAYKDNTDDETSDTIDILYLEPGDNFTLECAGPIDVGLELKMGIHFIDNTVQHYIIPVYIFMISK